VSRPEWEEKGGRTLSLSGISSRGGGDFKTHTGKAVPRVSKKERTRHRDCKGGAGTGGHKGASGVRQMGGNFCELGCQKKKKTLGKGWCSYRALRKFGSGWGKPKKERAGGLEEERMAGSV